MKRRILKLGLFLLLGAIINIAVAWTYECRAYPKNVIDEAMTDDNAKAAMPIHWAPASAPLITVTGSRRIVSGRTDYVLFAFHNEMTSEGSIRYANQLFVWTAGWPCRGMQAWTGIGRTPSEIGQHGSWRVNWAFASESSRVRQHGLPLLPLWPGFAINTMLYAASVWLLFAAPIIPAAIRRRRRGRRGLCPVCAYPIGASDVCTECGKTHVQG